MNRRFRLGPPKQRLAQRSGNRIRKTIFPSGVKTTTPSCPSPPPHPHQRLPSVSQRKPSGIPCPQFTNTRPLASAVPLPATSKTRIVRGVSPLATTYRRDSSGEKQRPLGRGTSPVTTLT